MDVNTEDEEHMWYIYIEITWETESENQVFHVKKYYFVL